MKDAVETGRQACSLGVLTIIPLTYSALEWCPLHVRGRKMGEGGIVTGRTGAVRDLLCGMSHSI